MDSREKIDVVATTISGSLKDWNKVKHIIPLFNRMGMNNVTLCVVDSHQEARLKTSECIQKGGRLLISAGGSGTFNSMLEGCFDSEVELREITLGFLRKGSADLIGKVLGMPDEIDEAIKVFVNSINAKKTILCDVIMAESTSGPAVPRHFIGYAGAEIFGEIPYYTENRFMKYYKGVLGQLFGDLGPFSAGAAFACMARMRKQIFQSRRKWRIYVDGEEVSEDVYQTFIIVNGDLGKNLPLAQSVPLDSGDFYLFTLKDIGLLKLPGQVKHTWNASVLDNPEQWGFESYQIKKSLEIKPEQEDPFPVNVDGSTMLCENSTIFHICNQINLITR
jgi:diacylglycerol kinase family enzyme